MTAWEPTANKKNSRIAAWRICRYNLRWAINPAGYSPRHTNKVLELVSKLVVHSSIIDKLTSSMMTCGSSQLTIVLNSVISVPPSSEHYGTTKVSPPSDNLHTTSFWGMGTARAVDNALTLFMNDVPYPRLWALCYATAFICITVIKTN